ncbi:MAG TPA: response regulator transcription factor [Isosphaeraceae bacterium]|nr:response regulator transcription factor [Isosphaeraceae bacterium]
MDGTRQGKLLLVEDEHLLRRLVAEFLRGEAFDVIEAADGLEGASLFQSHGPFDLVLLDLNLPELSGLEVCSRIKKTQPQQPVLICSAAIVEDHVATLRALDVDQFLTKPYHPLELLERITRMLPRDRRAWPADRTPATPGSPWRVAGPSPGLHARQGSVLLT